MNSSCSSANIAPMQKAASVLAVCLAAAAPLTAGELARLLPDPPIEAIASDASDALEHLSGRLDSLLQTKADLDMTAFVGLGRVAAMGQGDGWQGMLVEYSEPPETLWRRMTSALRQEGWSMSEGRAARMVRVCGVRIGSLERKGTKLTVVVSGRKGGVGSKLALRQQSPDRMPAARKSVNGVTR